MADTYLTLEQFENFMRSLTMTMLDWDESNSSRDVRIGWQTEGAPAAGIEQNIIYLECFEIDNPYNRLREETLTYIESPEMFNMETSYTIVMQTNFILYGSDSFENAQRIRDQIFYPDNRLILSKSNLYPIHDIATPRRIPEFFNGQWWKRVDVSIFFNELVIRELEVPVIKSVEVFVDDSENSLIADINIP
jgi:hypothetical protein